MSKLQELREQKAKLGEKIKSLADIASDESRDWTAENEAEWVEVNADYDSVSAKAEKAERAESIEIPTAEEIRAEIGRNNPGSEPAAPAPVQCTEEHRALALQAWMRHNEGLEITEEQREACKLAGINHRGKSIDFRLPQVSNEPQWSSRNGGGNTIESRAAQTITTSGGGYVIPTGLMPTVDKTLLAFGGPRKVAKIIRTASGNPMTFLTMDDTSNTAAKIAINTAVSETAFALGQVQLDAYKYTSMVLVPQELLEDSAVNIGELVGGILGERLGRILGAAYTTGDGSGDPNGVVTGASAGKTAAATTSIAADELFDLVHSLDPAYRMSPSTGFMMHDNVLLALRKLKDSQNQYLWVPGLAGGEPDRLLGYPVTINQHMSSTITASDITALFGDFSKYLIRDVADIRFVRLDERYAEYDQTGFIVWFRTDSDYLQTSAVKKLTQAAS